MAPPPFLQRIFGITTKSITQHLVGFLDDDKGIRIDFGDQFFQLCHLLLFHRSQHHFGVLVAIATFAMEEGCATIQLIADLVGDLFIVGEMMMATLE